MQSRILSSARTTAPLVLAWCLAATAVHAQSAPPAGAIFRQSAPPPARVEVPGSVLTLPAPKQQAAHAGASIPVQRIVLVGNTRISTGDLRALVQGLQGRTVTLGALRQAAARITVLYQSRGYPLARAYIPAQTIEHGVVRIQIVEPTYDRIAVSGSRLNQARAVRTLGLASGASIQQASLNRGLLLLNRTPGVRVAGTLVPGAQPDTSTLKVDLSDTPRVHAKLHMDNEGNDYTGRTRGGVDVSLDNPFGQGAQAALTTLSTAGGLLHAGAFSLVSPDLHNGLRAGAYGSRTLYRLGGSFAALEQSGRVNQLGMDLSYPLVLQPGRLLQVRIDAVRNGFLQRTASVGTTSRSHIRLARLSVDGAWADHEGGLTTGGLSVAHGVLSMDSADARVADQAGARAAGRFWVGQLRAQRDQPLPGSWTLRLGFSGQLASHTLDGSEKFYLGGPYGVMSEPVNAGGGESGALLDARLAHALHLGMPGQLEAAFLLQSGTVWQRLAGGRESQHFSGAGVGLDYRFERRVHAKLAYVHALGRSSADSPRDGQWWARLAIDL